MADQTAYGGQRDFTSDTSPYNAIEFVVRMMMGGMATTAVVQVKSVEPAVLGANTGVVSVRPMVNQIDNQGVSIPHGEIFNLPYFRLQGGTNAVIIDPVVGDIGFCVIASRDISGVKATRQVSNPGSKRRFDLADGIYIGGILNGAPVQYVAFTEAGITVKSPGTVTIDAPDAHFTADVAIDGSLVVDGDAAVAGTLEGNIVREVLTDVRLGTHTTTGVQTGGGTSGPPTGGT